jgi:hypothetical protein
MGPVPPTLSDATPADSQAEHGSNMVVHIVDNAAAGGEADMSKEEVHPIAEVVEVIVPEEVVAEPTPADAPLAEPVVVEA